MSSCYNCAKSFSLLNRERACKKCGFAFCGNCLKNKVILPDPDGKMSEKSVCGSCHQRMTQPEASKMIRPPPDALIRRLESLETPPNPPITVYSKKMDRLKRGMSKEDAQIAERLEKLQSDRQTCQHGLPTDHEMAKRLAKLKGEDMDESVSCSTGSVLTPMPKKSDVEQTVELLSKIVDEVKLDEKLPKPDDEISERLARLRGQEHVKDNRDQKRDVCPEEFLSKFPKITNSKGENANTAIDIQRLLEEVSEENESDARQAIEAFETDQDLQKQLNEWRQKKKDQPEEKMDVDDDEGDDDQEAAKVVERVMAEAALEEDDDDDDLDDRIPAPPSKNLVRQIQRAIRLSESSDQDSDELPWCTICNENASLRCRGCEGDLYCRRCFRECHQEDIDLRDHNVEEYKAPSKKPS